MGGRVDVADVVRMLRACADGFTTRITKHSVMVHYGNRMGLLPKGPGIPRDASPNALRGVEVELAKVRKLAQNLGLPVECVDQYFPGLLRAS